MFSQQPMGMSLYEGRTRGKRIRYTFSDNDDEKDSEVDEARSRQSARSARPTPAPDQPRFTASGRQIRKPQTGAYGETKINGSNGTDQSNAPSENGSAQPYNAEDYDGAAKQPGAEGGFDEWKANGAGDDDDDDDGGGGGGGGKEGGDVNFDDDEVEGGGEDDDDDEEEADDADDESEWDDTAFLQQGGEKKSLRIILKVNKNQPSRAPGVAKDVATNGQANGDGPQPKPLSDKPNGSSDVVMKDSNERETLQNGHSPPSRNGNVAQPVSTAGEKVWE